MCGILLRRYIGALVDTTDLLLLWIITHYCSIFKHMLSKNNSCTTIKVHVLKCQVESGGKVTQKMLECIC